MTSITKAQTKDIPLLTEISKISFIESHGKSASEEDINRYIGSTFNSDVFQQELNDPNCIYSLIYHDQQPAGYSKIILNAPHPHIQKENITKLDRLYLLKAFYGLQLGLELFTFNIQLSQQNNQAGMWLYVWKENQRAVHFYKKTGFNVIGNYDFKLTKTHSNPNHHMLLMY